MGRKTRKTKVTKVTFMRARGQALVNRLDPGYLKAIGQDPNAPDWHPVEPDMLRYDLAFVNDEEPGLVAFPTFSSGHGGKVTIDRWHSHGYQLKPIVERSGVEEGQRVSTGRNEAWHRLDYFEQRENVKAGRGWFTFRRPLGNDGTPDYSALAKVPLTMFLERHPNDLFSEPFVSIALDRPITDVERKHFAKLAGIDFEDVTDLSIMAHRYGEVGRCYYCERSLPCQLREDAEDGQCWLHDGGPLLGTTPESVTPKEVPRG